MVEEESAEISRRINQATRNQTATTTLVSGGLVVHPVTKEESSLSQIPSNTILVQTTSTGKLFVKQCLKNNNNFFSLVYTQFIYSYSYTFKVKRFFYTIPQVEISC